MLVAPLLKLASGLSVLLVLTLELLVHPTAYINLLLVACSSLVGLVHLPWCQLLKPLVRLVQCRSLLRLWFVALIVVGSMVDPSVCVYSFLRCVVSGACPQHRACDILGRQRIL